MPAKNSFSFVKGEDAQINFTVRESDRASAAVVDITGWTFSFKVKRFDSDDDPSLVTATATATDPTNGVVTVTVPAADMEGLKGDYRHSLWRTNSGSKACLSRGPFSVVDSVEN